VKRRAADTACVSRLSLPFEDARPLDFPFPVGFSPAIGRKPGQQTKDEKRTFFVPPEWDRRSDRSLI
jgi:hypothetical protein